MLRGACIESGGHPDRWFKGLQQDERELTHLLIAALKDSSAVTVRHTLVGLRLLLPRVVHSAGSCDMATLLLSELSGLAATGYWLVRVELAELMASLEPLACAYILAGWCRLVLSTYLHLLADEDVRVRSAAAAGLAAVSSGLGTGQAFDITSTSTDLAFEAAKHLEYRLVALETLGNEQNGLPNHPAATTTLPAAEMAESDTAAFHIVVRLYEQMRTAPNKHVLFGCVEALLQLVRKFVPVQHPAVWGIHLARRPAGPTTLLTGAELLPASSPLQSPGSGFLAFLLATLSSSLACLELGVQAALLEVAAALFAGLVGHILRETASTATTIDSVDTSVSSLLVVGDPVLSDLGEQLVVHTVRLLAMLHHVLEETSPAATPTTSSSSKPSLPSLQTAVALSPIKKKNTEPASTPVSPPPLAGPPSLERSLSGKTDTTAGKGSGHVGAFMGSPLYVKLFEALKSALSVFKTSLDNKSEERLLQFVSAVLQCFSTVMEYSAGADLGKHVEEYLTYIKSCMAITPRHTLIAVQSLLRCLFRNNFTSLPASGSSALNVSSSSSVLLACPRLQTSPSIFEAVISNPYTSFTLEHGLNVEANEMMSSTSSLLTSSPFRPTSGRRSAERTSLASYIRLFEPMVIKALKHYTVSCQVRYRLS